MSVMKGDFLGFTFNGIHSSELGIMRVSDGSRYTENLLPTIQDKTTQIPGGDGTFYQGSFYTQKQISFPIVYDELTEEQLRRIKNLFGTKGIYDLIFDEVPYKIYKVKVTGTPNLKYVCFNKERDFYNNNFSYENLYGQNQQIPTSRVYKGEGQLSFVTYSPYAISRKKYIDQYNVENIPEWRINSPNNIYNNKYEWADSVGFLRSYDMLEGSTIDQYDEANNRIYVANLGDLPTDFKLKFFKKANKNPGALSLKIMLDNNTFLQLNDIELSGNDAGFQINTKLNLIEGIDAAGDLTGTLYNQYIVTGSFFKIPQVKDFLSISWMKKGTLVNNIEYDCVIEYNYLFY